MAIGMDEIVGFHRHAGNADFAAKAFRMHPRVRRPDRTGKRLEARSPLRNIADRAVGDDAETAERLVDIALNLAPERAVADIGAVDVLDHADTRAEPGPHILVVSDPPCSLLGGSKSGFDHRADRNR